MRRFIGLTVCDVLLLAGCGGSADKAELPECRLYTQRYPLTNAVSPWYRSNGPQVHQVAELLIVLVERAARCLVPSQHDIAGLPYDLGDRLEIGAPL